MNDYKTKTKTKIMQTLRIALDKLNRLFFPGWNDPEPEITTDQARASARAWGIVWGLLLMFVMALVVTLVSGCQREWHPELTGSYKVKERVCEKGSHKFEPQSVNLMVLNEDRNVFAWWLNFDSGLEYVDEIDSDCELDWNKAGGVSFDNILSSKKSSLMWGWRSVRTMQGLSLELSPYWHDEDGEKFHAVGIDPDIPTAVIDPDSEFFLSIVCDWENKIATWSLHIDETKLRVLYQYSREIDDLEPADFGRITNPWFGGNCEAPNDIILNYSVLNKKQAEQIVK